MNKISVLRADYYSDGTIIPLLITFSNGKCEAIASIKKVKWEDYGRRYSVHCTTERHELILYLQNKKWTVKEVEC